MITGALPIPPSACPCKDYARTDILEGGHSSRCPNKDRVAVDLGWLKLRINHLMRRGLSVSAAFEKVEEELSREKKYESRELNPF